MSQPTPVEKKVMVLGGAPEARATVQELLGLGYQVAWLASEAVPPAPDEVPELSVYDEAEFVRFEGQVGGFCLSGQRQGAAFTVSAAALVVATGNARYFPAERYPLALSAQVLTTAQVRQQLVAPRVTGAALPHRDQHIALLLDWGGETSKEIATETLCLALDLRAQWHCEVTVFYQNLKVDTWNLERLTRTMREAGIVFARYQEIKFAADDNGVDLSYIEGTLHADLLVLPEATRPREDTAPLAALLQVRLGEDGYFQDINIHQYRPGLSSRRGIFFAGRCHLDGDPQDIATDVAQAAANMDALLGRGWLEPDTVRAFVDSRQCIRCLTCIRTCPHAAVELAEYNEVTAARVAELACQGCGACIANCPVRAISLVGQALPAWMQRTLPVPATQEPVQ